jgi:hypothetical protein
MAQATMTLIAETATGMRAAGLLDSLIAAGIYSRMEHPKWRDKRLPPPRVQVWVAAEQVVRAKEVLAEREREIAERLAGIR